MAASPSVPDPERCSWGFPGRPEGPRAPCPGSTAEPGGTAEQPVRRRRLPLHKEKTPTKSCQLPAGRHGKGSKDLLDGTGIPSSGHQQKCHQHRHLPGQGQDTLREQAPCHTLRCDFHSNARAAAQQLCDARGLSQPGPECRSPDTKTTSSTERWKQAVLFSFRKARGSHRERKCGYSLSFLIKASSKNTLRANEHRSASSALLGV